MSDIVKIKSLILKQFDFRHWSKKPFIYYRDKTRLISVSLLKLSIKYFIYDSFKQEEIFRDEFGKRFEKYIEQGLIEAKVSYKPERYLKTKYSQGLKIVDFLVEDKILVECKATELDSIASVQPEDSKILSAIKNSIEKGLKQLYEYSNQLNIDNLIGIIVTYKPMYIGNGEEVLSGIMKEYAKSLTSEQLRKIPMENIHFLSLDNWDLLVRLSIFKHVSLFSLVNKINIQIKNENKFFEVCLDEMRDRVIPRFDFIDISFQKFQNSMQERINEFRMHK